LNCYIKNTFEYEKSVGISQLIFCLWGDVHPPADDIPDRMIGKDIGIGACLC